MGDVVNLVTSPQEKTQAGTKTPRR